MELKPKVDSRWRVWAAVLVMVIVAIFLLWLVFVGLTTSSWDIPLLTFLAFALWIAVYVFLSSHEESA
ncbi:MAG: hypothetical protein ACE5IO_00905 [Thermoplasmata archaeon]